MKKILLFLIITLLGLSFSACKKNNTRDTDTSKGDSGFSKTETTDENEKKYDENGNLILAEGEITKTNIFMIKDENETLLLSNSDVKKVFLKFDVATDNYVIQLSFTDEGAIKFEKATEDNIGKKLSIWVSVYIEKSEVEPEPFYDLQLISSPVVQEKITGKECIISGYFDEESAMEFFNKLTK